MNNEFVCKTATVFDMEEKWNYEISSHKNKSNWIQWKNEAVERVREGKSLSYYGVLNGKIITEATALFDKSGVQNSEFLVDENTAYLCAFRTVRKYQGKGYFSRLFEFMLRDLKQRGYTKVTLGVEHSDLKNLLIYQKFGFDEYIKSAREVYPDGTVIDVDYYAMKINDGNKDDSV